MSIPAVIDTNVIVAALMSRHGNAATVKVMNAVFDGIISPAQFCLLHNIPE